MWTCALADTCAKRAKQATARLQRAASACRCSCRIAPDSRDEDNAEQGSGVERTWSPRSDSLELVWWLVAPTTRLSQSFRLGMRRGLSEVSTFLSDIHAATWISLRGSCSASYSFGFGCRSNSRERVHRRHLIDSDFKHFATQCGI